MSTYRSATLCGVLATALLAGCTQPPPGPVSSTRLYAIDQTGAARQCTGSPVRLAPGKETGATMAIGNDGGWCATTVAESGRPYAAGLLTVPAAHGTVYIHTVGDGTRIDYTPDTGFAGSDSFTVTLLPGRPVLQMAVTVTR